MRQSLSICKRGGFKVCVICYIPKNKSITREDIEDMFYTNPDGAGFMYSDGRHVYFKKGFFDVNKFAEEFLKIPQNYERVAHFRIATSGGVKSANCHPFNITGDFRKMCKLRGVTNKAFMHNGIFSEYATSKEYSDTMLFNKYLLSQIELNTNNLAFLNKSIKGSKLAIMTPQKTYLLGDWQDVDGVKYSNLNHVYYDDVYGGYYDEPFFIKIKGNDLETLDILEQEGCLPELIEHNTFSVWDLPLSLEYKILK